MFSKYQKDILSRIRNKTNALNGSNKQKTDYKTGASYRKAAVLIPLVSIDLNWHILYTRRSDMLEKHKGQVSFPGGAVDDSDKSMIDAALRETWEEVGIKSSSIDVLGTLETMVTTSDYILTPVIGVVDWPQTLRLNPDEVSRAFTIPLSWLMDNNNWEERIYSHPSGWFGNVIFYDEYDGELLWGISAMITQQLVKLINE